MNEEKYYTCRYDRPFKEIMLNENNKDILKSLLELILEIEINDIKINHTERNTGNLKVKRKTYDALVTTSQGKIEIEVNNTTKDYVRPRNMAYISDVYAHHTLVGDTYNEDTLIVQINLSYGLESENNEWNNVPSRIYYIQDKEEKRFVNNFRIYEINMDYYKKLWYNKNELEIEKNKILVMLDLDKIHLSELSKKDKVVNKYMEELNKLNSNPEFREYMSSEEDERKIKNSIKLEGFKEGLEQGFEEGIQHGIEQGINQGIEQRNKEIVINLFKQNIDINLIAKCTGLNLDELNNIKINLG